MIDMSEIGAHLRDKVMTDEEGKAIYRVVCARRRLIWEARQRGESMPWDVPGQPIPQLSARSKAEAGIPLTEAEVDQLVTEYRTKEMAK